jgi:hypothetical protein
MAKVIKISEEVRAKLKIDLGTGIVTSTIPTRDEGSEPKSIDEIRGQLRSLWFMLGELKQLESVDVPNKV